MTQIFDNADFYPTPPDLAHRMLRKLTLTYERQSSVTLLEPSAGKGDLLDVALARYGVYDKQRTQARMYAIEKVPDLRAALTGKGYSVIGTDFLAFEEPYHFDYVVMNPPFSAGAAHLLKAWEVVAAGGEIVCLLNAETVRNPRDEKRRAVCDLIGRYGTVEYIADAFAQAERRTRVEVALVHLKKPAAETVFDFQHLRHEDDVVMDENAGSAIEQHDAIRAYVRSYETARAALVGLNQYTRTLHLHVTAVLPGQHQNGLIGQVAREYRGEFTLNQRLADLKTSYWGMVFARLGVGKRATSKFREDFQKFVAANNQLAFTEANIIEVLSLIVDQQQDMIMSSLLGVHEKITRHHYYDELRGRGWKTNKSWKVPPKFIIPMYREYETREFFDDLDRLCCYLSGKRFEDITPITAITERHLYGARADKLETTFFHVQTYLKGTAHLTWKDKKLLEEFNRLAADGHSIGSGKY
jgi:hypothetical protein